MWPTLQKMCNGLGGRDFRDNGKPSPEALVISGKGGGKGRASLTVSGGAQGPGTEDGVAGTSRPGHPRDCSVAPNGGVIAHLEKREFLPESALFCRLTPSTVLSPFKRPHRGKARSRGRHPGGEDCPSVLASLPPSAPLRVPGQHGAGALRRRALCLSPPLDQAPEAALCCSCPFIWNRLFTAAAKRAFHPLISPPPKPPPKPPPGRDFKAPRSGFSPACGRGRGPAAAGRKAAAWPRVHLRRPGIESSSVPLLRPCSFRIFPLLCLPEKQRLQRRPRPQSEAPALRRVPC